MGIMSPPPRRKYPQPPEAEKIPDESHACDRCGYSDGVRIAVARYVFVKVRDALYFCDHHAKRFGAGLLATGYEARKL